MCRVPVRIDDYDFVRRGDVQAYSAGAGRNQEDKLVLVAVEVVDGFSPVFVGHGPIEVADVVGRVFEEHLKHLEEFDII